MDDPAETFCFMVFEEFLMKRNMRSTLDSFRMEWNRPSEEATLVSWYEIALKLRLPEIVALGSENKTVMENLVAALIHESSIRNRRSPEVAVSGLATLPKLPKIGAASTTAMTANDQESPFAYQANSEKSAYLSAQQVAERARPRSATSPKDSSQALVAVRKSSPRKTSSPRKSKTRVSAETHAIIQKQLDALTGDKFAKVKLSSENWIPEIIRHKSVERELTIAQETAKLYHFKETRNERMQKVLENRRVEERKLRDSTGRLKVEKTKAEAWLDVIKEMPCGCCRYMFLSTSMPLKVSQKAIIDFRVKSKGNLNSYSVFGKQPPRLTNGDSDADREEADGGSKSPRKLDLADQEFEKHMQRYSVVPRCYDEVLVCLFCSQFFQDPEEYRPPFQRIYSDERHAHEEERRRKEEEYWDPLKMSEKFREAEEREMLAKKIKEDEEIARLAALEKASIDASSSSVAVGWNLAAGPSIGADSGVELGASEVVDVAAVS